MKLVALLPFALLCAPLGTANADSHESPDAPPVDAAPAVPEPAAPEPAAAPPPAPPPEPLEPAPVPQAPSASPRGGGFALAVRGVLAPFGEFGGEEQGFNFSVDTKVAFGIAAQAGFRVTEHFAVGFAPQFLFGIEPDVEDLEDTDSIEQLDLRVRATGYLPVSPTVSLVGFLAPGLSIVMAPDDTETGFGVGGGIGAEFWLSETIALLAEVGYQKWFFKIEGSDVETSFTTLTFGAGTVL